MSYGASHRELVHDTNEGQLASPPAPATNRGASLKGGTQAYVGEEKSLGNALVETANIAAKPIIQEQNRKAERDAYTEAGSEEGKQSADVAANAWHNKLFGPSPSLRGAQERIAEDNARNLYLKAQDELENGDAAGWDDETWNKWRDQTIEDEVNKYDSDGMKNHINTQMSKDFQKLERDRGFLHQQYLQAENRNAVLGNLATLAETQSSDAASSSPNRHGADAPERFSDLARIREDSGMSKKAFASAVAQTAMDEYAKGNDAFGKYAEENGYYDDLDIEDQQGLQSAQRIHELKHDEDAHAASQDIFGPRGKIARGDVSGAMEAFDAFVAQYPEAMPAGGRNEVKDRVEQQAWANAERQRVQQQRRAMGKEGARTGNWQSVPQYDSFGNFTGMSEISAAEKVMYTQEYAAEELDAMFHKQNEMEAISNGTVYERTPPDAQQRAQNYRDNSARVGEIMATSGVMLPEVAALINSTSVGMKHNLQDMDPGQAAELKADLDSLQQMSQGNLAVTQMMMEQMGEDYGQAEYTRKRLAAGDTGQQIYKGIMDGKHGAPSTTAMGSGVPGGGTGTTAYSPSRGQSRGMLSNALSDLNAKGIMGFGKLANTEDVKAILDTAYSQSLQRQGSTSASARAIAESDAHAALMSSGAAITGQNGKKEFIPGTADINDQLVQQGYENGLDDKLKEMAQNPVIMDKIRAESGLKLSPWMPYKNPLTSDGASVRSLPDGSVELVIPVEGKAPYRETINMEEKRRLTDKEQRYADRMEGGMQIIDNPEAWKKQTGKATPREELDDELRKKFISRHVNVSTPEGRAKAKNVTQANIDSMMPASEYNTALMEREQIAVEREARKEGMQDTALEVLGAIRPMGPLGVTDLPVRITKRALNKGDGTKKVERKPNVPYYRQGDSKQSVKERTDQALVEFLNNESR